MNGINFLGRAARKAWRVLSRAEESNQHLYGLDPSRADEERKRHTGPMAEAFFGPKRRLVDKWLHYLPIYDEHFGPYRGRDFRFLEIGVFKGGSLEMWRRYFGQKATIFGIDIDPACAKYVDPPNQVRIGSQADLPFLLSVVSEMGAPDVILDDGSHIGWHQAASFTALFPLLKDGGLYVIEDLHTSFWTNWGGGFRRKGTAIELVKSMIDDMHGWYHRRKQEVVHKDEIGAIHIYDSLVVIQKKRRDRPAFIQVPPQIAAA